MAEQVTILRSFSDAIMNTRESTRDPANHPSLAQLCGQLFKENLRINLAHAPIESLNEECFKVRCVHPDVAYCSPSQHCVSHRTRPSIRVSVVRDPLGRSAVDAPVRHSVLGHVSPSPTSRRAG